MNRWLACAAGLTLAACASPCDSLADRVCAQRPAPDPVCVRLRAVAQAPSAADRQACESGNAVADDLQKH